MGSIHIIAIHIIAIQHLADKDQRNNFSKIGHKRYSGSLSYTIIIFPLFFYFDYLLDSVMPQHLFHVPHSITNNLCHSVLLSSITPHFCLLSSVSLATCFHHLPSSDSLPLCSVSIFIFSTSIHYSLPPHSDFVYLSFCFL